MAPARGPQPLWASGGPKPTLLRQWSARGGGNISNLVSSRFASGSEMFNHLC
ncbi:hypothetical protein DPMN_045872 [Dreissena polymorpha]|uniref:Uncharacterized protein n=1 Tax=Dreissena polymorpha TaxID=45954 RepID=A0A9D4I032_DREPO|nr:hypothetical protein DPMN_045872 [Dreissena polymorpha]